MKKIFGEIMICMLVIVFLFFGQLADVNGYMSREVKDANQSISNYRNDKNYDVVYTTYLQAYFDNLNHNLGKNYQGSCCYVALGMILSYYDTFLNDDNKLGGKSQ